MQRVMSQWTPALAGQLAGFYQDLHRHPELSFQEHRTAAKVAGALRDLDCAVTTGIGGTGVVAVLRNGTGPTVMLRADMDALPVQENTGLPYASTARGVDAAGKDVPVMHACGHDMHTACLLGALTLLDRGRDTWSGTILGVFQPAEELAVGAQAMIDDGLFDRFGKPEIVLAQHVSPFPAGVIGYGSGPFMAANDSLQVTLFGRGGHGSAPESTVDPVLMAAAIVLRLQGILGREVSMHDQAVMTVGRLQAGTKDNIIPDTAELGINIRTYSALVRDRVRAAVERVIRAEAMASNAPAEPALSWSSHCPVLVNDPDGTAATVTALTRHLGEHRLMPFPPVAASEDVGAFGAAAGVPTVYWFWGGADPAAFQAAQAEGRMPAANHTPEFAPALEPALASGVEALTVAALASLGPGLPRPPAWATPASD